MTHGSLFSGIGGFDLAANWMGWENKFHCEINPFCQKVLNHYWPDAKSYTDITKTSFTEWHGSIDILSGGFPCQPYSVAGNRKGKEDERHLWPHMRRAIREIKPRWIVGENVRGIISWNGGLVFNEVCIDLETEGYNVLPVVLPASAVNADHKRERVWFIAYANSQRRKECNTSALPTKKEKRYEWNNSQRIVDFGAKTGEGTVSELLRTADGLSERLAPGFRNACIKGLGNAIVPQVAFEIFKTIELYELMY